MSVSIAAGLGAIEAGLRVLYMSGYSHDVLAPQALTENGNSAFIEKPFNAQALLKAARKLLERPAPAV
jgi:FixJ family two-component response regulator